jgi:hypothetical protein
LSEKLHQLQAAEHIPCLHNEEVDDANFESQEDTIADVVLPGQGIERDTVDKLIEKQRRRNAKVQPHKTLGTQSVRQDFSRVASHDARLDVVEDAVEKDGHDEAFAQPICGRDFVARRDDGEDVEYDKGPDCRDEVNGPPTKLVDEEGEEEVLAERQRLHAAVDTELSLGIRHPNTIHDVLQIVRDQPVAAPLREEADGSDDADPLAVAFGFEEIGPTRLAALFVELNGGLDFGVLELHEFVVLIAFAVPVRKDVQGFFVAVFVAEPAWGFGHEEDEDEDYDGADGLKHAG